jgi:hypothetical protein
MRQPLKHAFPTSFLFFSLVWGALISPYVSFPSTLNAHGRVPEAQAFVFHPQDESVLVVNTTVGLLFSFDGGASYAWSCRNLFKANILEKPTLIISQKGTMSFSLFRGLMKSDSGCRWEFPSAQFQGLIFADQAIDPLNPVTIYSITSMGNQPNWLYKTTNNAETWEKVGEAFPPHLFESVAIAQSNPSHIYLSGSTLETPKRAFIFHSEDSGVTWEEFFFSLSENEGTLKILDTYPDRAEGIYLYYEKAFDSPQSLEPLLRSEDFGESLETLIDIPDLEAFAQSEDGTTLWVGGRDTELPLITQEDSAIESQEEEEAPKFGLWRSKDQGDSFEHIQNQISISSLSYNKEKLWIGYNDSEANLHLGISGDLGQTLPKSIQLQEIDNILSCEEQKEECLPELVDLIYDLSWTSIDPGIEIPKDQRCVYDIDAGLICPNPLEPPEKGCTCNLSKRQSKHQSAKCLALLLIIFIFSYYRKARKSEVE